VLFIIISNYFAVLAPQVTGYVIDYVQRSLKLPGYRVKTRASNYDVLVQKFIDNIESMQFSVPQIVAISGIIIILLALLRGMFLFFMRQTIIVMSRHIEYDQKNDVYFHYQKLDINFFKQNSIGDLMSRIAEDVSRVRMFTGPAIMYLINLTALISLSIFFMYKRSPELTFYVLSPLPVLAITIYLVNNIIHKKSEGLQATLASLTTNAQQSYSGIRVIKSFVQENAMMNFFRNNSEKYRKDAVQLARIESLYFPSMSFFIGLSTLLTIMIGGMQYMRGSADIGLDTIVEFIIYINMLTFPVSAIGWTASMIQRAAASQKRLNEFLQTKPQIENAISPVVINIEGDIEFKTVDFTYPNTGIHALKNFNLKINAGDKVAIVGRTGSGKTTIVQLLLRMYDPTSGEVIIDNCNVTTIDLATLRSAIAYVPQDGFLFSDSVERNICFGLTETDSEKAKEAAQTAAVEREILGFADGYKTLVGERGVTLSGGQKQRVSIARAVAKKSPVLVMDDSLSAVDARTEMEIFSNIQKFMKDKTAIVITHKITGLTGFDNIVVLEEGSIIEMGKHAELMQKKSTYYEMYVRQLVQERN
jgi:ATP-binding cassette subfamily B protein